MIDTHSAELLSNKIIIEIHEHKPVTDSRHQTDDMLAAAWKLLPGPGVSRLSRSVSSSAARSSVTVMALSNFRKTMKTPFVGAFQMISDPIGCPEYALQPVFACFDFVRQ